MDGLGWLNTAPPADAVAAFFRCCGCAGWAGAMAAARPFPTEQALFAAAETEWSKASREDILEAISHHPRIGDRESLKTRFPETHAWASGEQSGAYEASGKVLEDLAEANREYESRFGHIFIVCATGKTASEMLSLLRARLANDPKAELAITAGEQAKITRLRLEKRLAEAGNSQA